MKKLFFLLLLTGIVGAKPLGKLFLGTYGAGDGTLVQTERLDSGKYRLSLEWKGRGPQKGSIVLTPEQVRRLESVLEQALKAAGRGKHVEIPVTATPDGSRLVYQVWAKEPFVLLSLKPPGKTQWKDFVQACVNMTPQETEKYRQLLREMR